MDEATSRRGGWIGYGSGSHGKDHLPPDIRAEAERLEAAQAERRGRLLCEVVVMVYERDAIPSVAFPRQAALGVESASDDIAAAVDRARAALGHWR